MKKKRLESKLKTCRSESKRTGRSWFYSTRFTLIWLALLMPIGIALGQHTLESSRSESKALCLDRAVLNAVIDSALAYEVLKPIVRELRIITTLQDEENANLREVIRLKDLQDGLVRKQIDRKSTRMN